MPPATTCLMSFRLAEKLRQEGLATKLLVVSDADKSFYVYSAV
jgi:hypothetical protein